MKLTVISAEKKKDSEEEYYDIEVTLPDQYFNPYISFYNFCDTKVCILLLLLGYDTFRRIDAKYITFERTKHGL